MSRPGSSTPLRTSPPSDDTVRSVDFASSPSEEEQRLAALYRYEVLDTTPEKAFDRITEIAAHLFGAPFAFVSLIDEDRQWMKACVGLDAKEIDLSTSFCIYAIQTDDILVIPDATRDERVRDTRFVAGDPGIRFYAGAPLRTSDGYRIGTLCVLDSEPRPGVDAGELTHLAHLADLVVDELELRREVRRREEREKELESAREEADRARAEAEAANETMSRFFAGVAHDLQNPLTSIMMVAELLKTLVDETAFEYVERVQRAGQRMQSITESLLDLGKLRSGTLHIDTGPEDVVGVAREAVDGAQERPEADDRRAILDVPDDPVAARIDPDALRRVLGNLVGNAFKHTQANDTVRVRVRGNGDAGTVVIDVIDTGPGIPDDVMDTIFDPFARGGEDTEGAGLGLAIAKDLTEAMGGRIEVSSEAGEGTCFRVVLPAADS